MLLAGTLAGSIAFSRAEIVKLAEWLGGGGRATRDRSGPMKNARKAMKIQGVCERWALAGLLAGSLLLSVPTARAQSSADKDKPATAAAKPATAADKPATAADKPATAAAKSAAPAAPMHYRPDRFAGRAGTYYKVIWGVDSLSVKWTESGEVIRFTYRVVDADKARMLNEKKAEPSLIAPRAGVSLVVPSFEKVGQLRQSAPPENGKSYWMAFSNKGRLVKRGDHVSVVIGNFHADGLVVD